MLDHGFYLIFPGACLLLQDIAPCTVRAEVLSTRSLLVDLAPLEQKHEITKLLVKTRLSFKKSLIQYLMPKDDILNNFIETIDLTCYGGCLSEW